MTLTLRSPAFDHLGPIPVRHTCDGEDTPPPLEWAGVPAAARSLVLIVDDPDAPDPQAPRMTWIHWVLYNLPAGAGGLVEGVTAAGLPPGALDGLNSWNRTGYGGPCPPIGRHRYFHKLLALDTVLPDLGTPDIHRLQAALAGHVLERVELVGTYQR